MRTRRMPAMWMPALWTITQVLRFTVLRFTLLTELMALLTELMELTQVLAFMELMELTQVLATELTQVLPRGPLLRLPGRWLPLSR